MKKKIAILGATGSIGSNTIDVVKAEPDLFEIVLLTANTSSESLLRTAAAFPRAKLAVSGLSEATAEITYAGAPGLLRAIAETEPDIVVNGIAGAAGLLPSIAALENGADLALANKETIVMAAPVVFEISRRRNAQIIPVDSEHSAIFLLLEAHGREILEEIILTASGGPFRGFTLRQLESVGFKEALQHPTWKMGGKITIDSASLANKGLEVIEAVHLFGIPPEKVTVLVHPQSVVHSLIRLLDGSMYAQMSYPDIRSPIQSALHWPDCAASDFGRFSLENLTLSFEKPDTVAFPMLGLAYEAARRSGRYPTAYNAANEVAVEAFMAGRIGFLDISRLTQSVLESDWADGEADLEAIVEADVRARAQAVTIIRELR